MYRLHQFLIQHCVSVCFVSNNIKWGNASFFVSSTIERGTKYAKVCKILYQIHQFFYTKLYFYLFYLRYNHKWYKSKLCSLFFFVSIIRKMRYTMSWSKFILEKCCTIFLFFEFWILNFEKLLQIKKFDIN